MDFFSQEALLNLFTLTGLEIVLGVDNVIFIACVMGLFVHAFVFTLHIDEAIFERFAAFSSNTGSTARFLNKSLFSWPYSGAKNIRQQSSVVIFFNICI